MVPYAARFRATLLRRGALLAGMLLLVLSACSSRPQPQTGSVYVMSDPPPRREEIRPERSVSAAVWIPGQWRWNGYRYVWLPGYWESSPRGMWVPGHWARAPHGWVWVYGYWR